MPLLDEPNLASFRPNWIRAESVKWSRSDAVRVLSQGSTMTRVLITSHFIYFGLAAINSYRTPPLVPLSKKSGPDSVNRYCKALFRGINVTTAPFGLPDAPRCKEICKQKKKICEFS